jgi:hypothetical protein
MRSPVLKGRLFLILSCKQDFSKILSVVNRFWNNKMQLYIITLIHEKLSTEVDLQNILFQRYQKSLVLGTYLVLRESGTLLIFKVKGQGHRVKFLGEGIWILRGKNLTRWPWKSIEFQILLRIKYVPSLVKIHWRMLILVFTRMLHGKNWPGDLDLWPWPCELLSSLGICRTS